MEQRTKEWHNQRVGKFTASEIHKLLGVKGLGETGKSYAFEKAVEIVFGLDEEDDFCSVDMQRGVELEPFAFRKFKELKSLDFIDVKECGFSLLDVNSGASPDGLLSDGSCLEIKCPRPVRFFQLLATKEIDSKYIAQMQMQMLATKAKKCHFFNYIIYNSVEMWNEIVVESDEKLQSLILERIQEAVVIRDMYIEQLRNNKQF